MATRACQRKLEFPVRKSSRLRGKKAEAVTETATSVKKNQDALLSEKTVNAKRSSRKNKKTVENENALNNENILNLEPRICLIRSPLKSPVKISSLQSPMKNVLSTERVTVLSPRKRPLEENNVTSNVTTESPIKSPRKTCALSVKDNELSSRKLFPTELSASRSPLKNPAAVCSPRKTPVKVNSPLRTPVKTSNSSRKENVPSPRKRLLQDDNTRKDDHASPVKLYRQEGHCYQRVKKVLHTAAPERLVGRDKETATIDKFLTKHLLGKVAGSLYVSGAPGTGKTAVLSRVMETYKEKSKHKSIFINCMSAKNSAAIFNKVATELQGKSVQKNVKESVKHLEKQLTSTGPMVLLILDEIDQLDSKNQEVLYTMFEWPALKNSRLVLIGIANALDLTDRILPRLQAHPKCKPQLLNFAPYTRQQITEIIQDRLKQVDQNDGSLLDPSAVQFCARKVSAVAGDMRKALDVCRRAVEVVETKTKQQTVLKPSTTDCNSPRKRTPVPRKIGVADIANVVSEVYGTGAMTNPQGHQQTIPLQQKIVICTLLLLTKQVKNKEVILGKLHESYAKICKKRQMTSSDQCEFLSLCTLLETRGIVCLKKAKETRMTKVSLKLDEKEVEYALQDKLLLTSIFSQGL